MKHRYIVTANSSEPEVYHDGNNAHCALVAQRQAFHAVSLGLVHHSDKYIPQCRRLCLFLRIESARGNDKHCVHDKARKCCGVVSFRSSIAA